MLARRQSLAYQEMKLSQLREEFHLQEELTKLDAEKEVFEEVLKSDGKITFSIFNPEKSLSSLGRSAKNWRSVPQSSAPRSEDPFPRTDFSDVMDQDQPMKSVPHPSPPRSAVRFLQPVSDDVTSQWMKSVPHPSPPRSAARFLQPVSGDVTSQWMKSVPHPSPPRSAGRLLQPASCDFMNQPVMSVTQHNPLRSLYTVPFDVLPHHLVTSERQEIRTSQAARFYSDYDDDSLQEQPHATVRVEDPCSNMMKSHESAKQMYSHGEQQSSEINTKPSSRAVRQHSPSVSSEYGNAYLTTMKKLADASGYSYWYSIALAKHGRSSRAVFLSEEEGYKEAKRLLEERFGNKYKVSNSWINKVSDGPPIRPNDREALMDLADDLQNCEITLRATGRLNQVNNEDKLVRILERCPGYIRGRWQSRVQDIREDCREPNIEDVRRLVRKVAIEKNDPVFVGILDGGSKDGGTRNKKSLQSAGNRNTSQRNMTYSVQTKDATSSAASKPNGNMRFKCYLCEADHKLEDCELFKKKTGDDQRQFVGTLSETGAGCGRKSLLIVPVKVRCPENTGEVVTYALLNNGLTASFCSEDLLAKLGIAARKCQISVATISNVMENCDSAVASLKIMDLNKTVSIDVPQAFVVKKLCSPKKYEEESPEDHLQLEPSLVGPTDPSDRQKSQLHTVNKDLQVKYTEFIEDLQVKGYSRTVPEEKLHENNGKVWYLPHHNIINPKKPEKTRVVFDCAAKFQGKSLNEHVMQGPDFTNSLVGVLLRFRQENVALIANVEAMFHQVRVKEDDVSALRFLWFPNGDLSKDPEERQMLVHLFGGIWSPSCATFALQKTAEDHKAHCKDSVISTVKRNFYVDDLLKSVKNSKEAVSTYNDLKSLLSLGGFYLTKWISNKRDVIDAIPKEDHSKELKKIDVEKDLLPVNRALGVQWNVSNDSFQYDVNIPAREVTKRGILSFVSSIYDPLGIVAPFVLTAKIILQELCLEKLGWDDEIPQTAINRWNSWIKELPNLVKLAVPRCFQPENFGEVKRVELHHFCDASENGYGASYVRTISREGEINCSFAIGKSRLAPLKPMTIPRLELSAATVAVKLDRMLKRELEICVEKSVFWTDSTAVIKYINNE
eukprot:gene21143-biopygen14691